MIRNAVDAVADDNAGRLRLDVHVARSCLDRFDENFVDKANDRWLLGFFESSDPSVTSSSRSCTSSVFDSKLVTVSLPTPSRALISLAISARAASTRNDVQASARAEFIQRIKIKRIAGRDNHAAVMTRNGIERLTMQQLRGKRGQQRVIDRGFVELDKSSPTSSPIARSACSSVTRPRSTAS